MWHDWENNRPLELPYIYERPLAAAREAGLELPRIQQLYQQLLAMVARRDGSKS